VKFDQRKNNRDFDSDGSRIGGRRMASFEAGPDGRESLAGESAVPGFGGVLRGASVMNKRRVY
jgi:hypothetical protein